jgi:hypothetical protein
VRIGGLRVHANDSLMAPMFDAEKHITNLVIFGVTGERHYLSKDYVLGYFGIGTKTDIILVAAGLLAGARAHQASQCAVAISFATENIPNVVEIMRRRHPSAQVVLAQEFLTVSQLGTDNMHADVPALPRPVGCAAATLPPNSSSTVAAPGHLKSEQPSASEPLAALAAAAAGKPIALDRSLLTCHPDAMRLLDWIEHKRWPELTRSRILQFGPSRLRNAEVVKNALLTLVEHGWMVTEDGTRCRVLADALGPSKTLPASR